MTDFDNNLRGALFRNDKKESDSHPDYKGSCEIAGTEYWISAWLKESKAGATFMSLSFKDKAETSKPKAETKAKPKQADFEDSVPF